MDIGWSDYTALKTELVSDPKSLGSISLSSEVAAKKINLVGASTEKIDRRYVNGQECMNAVVVSEYAALSAAARDGWTSIIAAGNGEVDIRNTNVRAQILAIWAAGTTTRTNLALLQQRLASRAEFLFGEDVIIHKWDVARARAI